MSLGGVLLFALFSLSRAQGTYVIYKSLGSERHWRDAIISVPKWYD